MEKTHELTNRLGLYGDSYTDSIIRKWLEERAAKLCEYCEGPLPREIYKELRLNHDGKPMTWKTATTDEGEKPCHLGCKSGEGFHLNPKQKQSWWCEHMEAFERELNDKLHLTAEDYKGPCPICGTPRPKNKSLEEVVAEAIKTEMNVHIGKPLGWSNESLAKVAIEAVRRYKEEL